MKRLAAALSLAALISHVSIAHAVSISGITLYATDDFGNLNGITSLDGIPEGQLWHTALTDKWHGLAVFAGLPPSSFGAAPYNAPNFMVEIPLDQGENVFTLLGDPGPLSDDQGQYERFSVNLYFDGAINAAPGLTVLFSKLVPPAGGPVAASRSDILYNLFIQQVDGHPQTFYDDGIDRVTVTAASFVLPNRFTPPSEIDFLSPHSFKKDDRPDFLGVLKVTVEPSQSTDEQNVAPKGINPGFGGGAGAGFGGGSAGGAYPAGGYPNAGYGGLPNQGNTAQGDPYGQRAAQVPVRPTVAAAPTAASEEDEATPEATALQTGSPARGAPAGTTTAGTPSANTTPTPGSASTASAQSTPSAAVTANAGTTTPAQPIPAGTRTPAKTPAH